MSFFLFLFLLLHLLPRQSKNKVSLRNLSMVLRQLPVVDKAAPGKQVLESVELARQAVQLDVADGTSWCEYRSRSLECINLSERVENQWHFQFNSGLDHNYIKDHIDFIRDILS